MKKWPRVWAEVDLSAISHNLAVIRNRLRGRRRIMLVLKADAYGHGAIAVARHVLARGEAQAFGVGDSEEALELRQAGVDAPILILGAIVDGEMKEVIQHDVAVCVHSRSRVRLLEREARRQGRKCRVHVMVDTGMGRLGPFPETALEVARAVAASEWLELEGIATHFSSTQSADDSFTRQQLVRFSEFRKSVQEAGIPLPICHAANSGAVLFEEQSAFDLVRVGAAVYGIFARRDGDASQLRPSLSLHTQVIYLKDVPSGTPISYNRLFTTRRKTRIATLPIGYNDGLSYGLSNRGHVLIRGKQAPIVGAVSMDYCMVDVGEVPGARAGDPVTVIGADGTESITVPQMAEMLHTVPYEITCRLGRRVKRVHLPARKHPSLAAAVGPREEQVLAAERVAEH
ncbi:MAG: alanine racemase [Planctomycetes bacterium]|nr:alanine racemase [Planctomycetota bacterium]